jgi:hypothetical protein
MTNRRDGGRALAAAVVACLLSGLLAAPAAAQNEPASVMLLFDSSGSMKGDDGAGTRKIDAARSAIDEVVRGFPKNARVGLRVFGGRIPSSDKRRGCRDSRIVIPLGRPDPQAARARVRSYTPKGFTPIALSLERAAEDLGERGTRTIVLVSDGEDTCVPPRPCDVARRVAGRGIDIRIQAIGFRVNDAARRELRCIASAGGGLYRDADNADELAEELRAISTRALRTYEPEGKPVSGGPDIRHATEVTPGQYVDRILPNEEKWYAVKLERRETLTAAAAIVPPTGVGDVGTVGAAFRIKLWNPRFSSLGYEDFDVNLFAYDVPDLSSIGTFGKPAGQIGDDTVEVAESDGFGLAGAYYVQVSLEDSSDRELTDDASGRPYRLELLFDVLGRPSVAARPVGAATRPGRGGGGDEGGGSDDLDTAVIAAVAGALAALGAGLGAFLALRRRGRRA